MSLFYFFLRVNLFGQNIFYSFLQLIKEIQSKAYLKNQLIEFYKMIWYLNP